MNVKCYLDDLKMLLNKCKFVCLKHSETKQTKILAFGAGHCKSPKLLEGFWEGIFKGKVRMRGCMLSRFSHV